ncbi:MAG: hypothetical protein H6667_15700 [Ardenticatenaceae bacterium]|nr:hypothetical protein [Ardenticatenaceae bacterium]
MRLKCLHFSGIIPAQPDAEPRIAASYRQQTLPSLTVNPAADLAISKTRSTDTLEVDKAIGFALVRSTTMGRIRRRRVTINDVIPDNWVIP